MKNRSDALVAGLTMLCSLALLAALFVAISGNPWQKPHLRFSVDFKDVTGMGRHSPVFYAGSKVGVIDAVEHLAPVDRLQPDSTIRVHVAILEPCPIAANLRVAISAESILGEKHLALSRINDEGGLLAEGTKLISTSTGTMLEMLLPGGDQIVADLGEITQSLREITRPLAKQEPGKKISSTLGHLDDFSQELKSLLSGAEGKPGLGPKLHTMVDSLKGAAGKLEDTVASVGTSLHGPADKPSEGLTAKARATLANLESFSGELKQMLSGGTGKPGLAARLDAITKEAQAIFAGPPNEPEEALQKRLDAVLVKTEKVMEEMNALIVWGQYVTGTLAGKPNRLIFGNQENDVPTKQEIIDHLRQSKEAFPVEIKEEVSGTKRGTAGAITEPQDDPAKRKGLFPFKSRP